MLTQVSSGRTGAQASEAEEGVGGGSNRVSLTIIHEHGELMPVQGEEDDGGYLRRRVRVYGIAWPTRLLTVELVSGNV